MDDKEMFDLLSIYTEKLKSDIQAILKLNGKYATGKLYNSVNVASQKKGDDYEIVLSIINYGKYVQSGRKPGSMPPFKAISDWAKIKGIPQEAVYPIMKKIEKVGIKPLNFLKPIEEDRSWLNSMIEGMGSELKEKIRIQLIKTK